MKVKPFRFLLTAPLLFFTAGPFNAYSQTPAPFDAGTKVPLNGMALPAPLNLQLSFATGPALSPLEVPGYKKTALPFRIKYAGQRTLCRMMKDNAQQKHYDGPALATAPAFLQIKKHVL